VSVSTILDVALGSSFVFVLLSVIGSAVTEAISGVFALRAITLRQGIERLLKDQTLVRKLYEHPLIDGLTKDEPSDPAYIPSDLFARALVDVITHWDDQADRCAPPASTSLLRGMMSVIWRNARHMLRGVWPGKAQPRQALKCAESFDEFRGRLTDAKNFEEDTRAMVRALLADGSVKTLEDAYARIATWFDRSMESVTGWYKRSAQVLICTVAMVLSIGLNVDTFVLVDSLARDAVLRASVATAVEQNIKSGSAQYQTADAVVQQKRAGDQAAPQAEPPKTNELIRKQVIEIKSGLDELNLPVGWPEAGPLFCRASADGIPCDRRALPVSFGGWTRRGAGWLFTAILISLGAPFWFDLLNKLINLRAAAPPPAKAPVAPRAVSGVGTSVNVAVNEVVRAGSTEAATGEGTPPPSS
jgi:hypothetical protein